MYKSITLVGLFFVVSRIGGISPDLTQDIGTFQNQKRYYSYQVDEKLINWMKTNVSPETKLPLSFYIHPSSKKQVYSKMGKSNEVSGIIERMIVEEGLIVYDGAVSQIVLTLLGSTDNLKKAYRPIEVYWDGRFRDFDSIRAGYPVSQFIYDPSNPTLVSSDLKDKGERGFLFRIINAHGRYNTADPLDGKTELKGFPTWPRVHWEDWKPVAGENAWVTMAALQLYHKKYFDPVLGDYTHNLESIELKLAEEIARAALILQAENGGIRMGPIGAYRNPKDFKDDTPDGYWWYYQISNENNISWYAAFQMLYTITNKKEYKTAMDKIESYFKLTWNKDKKYFYQGMTYTGGQWELNEEHFALDVQTWAIACFGPEKIDGWFGAGTSYHIFRYARTLSGVRSVFGYLLGVGYTKENNRLSVEWTAGAILAALEVARAYKSKYPQWADEVYQDAINMRRGINFLRSELTERQAAYSYSSRRDTIPFGWNSHVPEVLSLASTAWVVLIDAGFNPFRLSGKNLSENDLAVSHIP